MKLSPDGNKIVSCAANEVMVWDYLSRERLYFYKEHSNIAKSA